MNYLIMHIKTGLIHGRFATKEAARAWLDEDTVGQDYYRVVSMQGLWDRSIKSLPDWLRSRSRRTTTK
jgi:hypothetical protein